MRLRGFLGTVAVLASVVHVAGVVVNSRSVAMGVPLVAAAVPLACAMVLARRSAARLAGAGMVLLAVPAVVAVGRAAWSVPLTVRYESGNTASSYLVSTVDLAGSVDVGATVSAGALLAGVALVVAACLRRADSPAVD